MMYRKNPHVEDGWDGEGYYEGCEHDSYDDEDEDEDGPVNVQGIYDEPYVERGYDEYDDEYESDDSYHNEHDTEETESVAPVQERTPQKQNFAFRLVGALNDIRPDTPVDPSRTELPNVVGVYFFIARNGTAKFFLDAKVSEDLPRGLSSRMSEGFGPDTTMAEFAEWLSTAWVRLAQIRENPPVPQLRENPPGSLPEIDDTAF